MGARDLLNDLTEAGLTVECDGDSLVIRPASRLTDDLRALVRDAKPELLVLLGEDLRLTDRRERLLRWGWPAADAEALAQRLARRESDARVSCVECRHYRPGNCSSHRGAALQSPEVGRDLAGTLQWCPAFSSADKGKSQ